MTVRPPPLDPDDPTSSAVIEAGINRALSPLAPAGESSVALRQRLLDRAQSSREAARRFVSVRRDEGAWRPLTPGTRVKMLHDGAATRSTLIDLAPGGALPAHRHHEHEECVVLRGEARLGELVVREGDYHVAPAGSRHGRVTSREGALLYLRGVSIGDAYEVARDVVTAWLPGRDVTPITVRSNEGIWSDPLPGVQTKALWSDGNAQSMLIRLQPGARVQSYPRAIDEECLILDGEMFRGDMLLRAGDYQLVPAGAGDGDLTSDVGAIFFVRGAAGPPAAAR